MYKAEHFIKCRHCKSIHRGANIFTLEGTEANPKVHPRKGVIWNVLLKNIRLQIDWLLRQRLVQRYRRSRSTSRYVFFMGNTMFTWLSKKQPIVTFLICEAEYVAASLCVCHAIWLKNLLIQMELKQVGATVIQIDNKSAIELGKNPMNHEIRKHIDVHFHFIRNHVKEGNMELTHVASLDQAADIFTKSLPKVLLDKC